MKISYGSTAGQKDIVSDETTPLKKNQTVDVLEEGNLDENGNLIIAEKDEDEQEEEATYTSTLWESPPSRSSTGSGGHSRVILVATGIALLVFASASYWRPPAMLTTTKDISPLRGCLNPGKACFNLNFGIPVARSDSCDNCCDETDCPSFVCVCE